ncbi:CHAT domain-containing protein [Dactylosporangium sucinum]|uniref:CHAT domain-containing protein n=1 Tax=Dactylosporangium sucinum TaxID=1424081 RepID=UPI00167E384A|nr:CHAT domain-containing tetratricopeptide repeat protein [Dactylosporangium sucinum]
MAEESGDDLATAVAHARQGRALADRHDDRGAVGCYRAALPPAERALAAEGTDDHIRFVVYLHDMLGVLTLGQSWHDEAERHFTAALRLSRERDPGGTDEAKFVNNLGAVARARGDQRGALRRYREALEIAGRIDPPPDAIGSYLSNTGTALLALGRLDDALAFFRRALEIDERVDPAAAATDRSLIASVLIEYGDLEEARGHYAAALAFHEAHDPGSFETARELVNVGYVHRLTGNLDEALRQYLRALDIDQRIAPDGAETAADLNNIARVYRERGDLDRCRGYLSRAVQISRRVAPLSQRTAVRLNNLAELDHQAGRREEARRGFTEALRIDEAVAPLSLETARDLNNLAALALDEHDLDTARDLTRRALEISLRVAPQSHHTASGYGTLAVIANERGAPGVAIRWARAALAIDRRQTPLAASTVADLVNLAVLYTEAGDADRAVRHYAEAVSVVESMRTRAGLPLAREEVFALHQRPYSGLIRALLTRDGPGDAERAFAVAEQGRGRALADLLQQRRLDLRPRGETQRELLAEQRRIEARLHHARQHGRDDDHDLAEQLERVQLRIRREFPAYAQLREPSPVDLTGARALLDDATLLLAYHVDAGFCVAWAVRRTGCAVLPVRATEDRIRGLVEAVLRACATGDEAADGVPGAAELAELLIAPAQLLDGVRQLVVVPAGPLAYLPFELLPYRAGCLGDRIAVSYLPSVTVGADLRERRADRPASWSRRPFAGFGLDEHLPGTREVVEIAAEYGPGARAWTGRELTKALVRRESAGHRVVHFATHGVVDDRDPLDSGLTLAGGAVLRAAEMFDLRLDAQVVVCSACETATGRIRAGEGLVGMSRALFYAGARSLVVSLWPVADRPTRRLMRRLHDHLRAGHAPADALWRAKRQVRQSHPQVYRHPREWAGFILLGDGHPGEAG